MLLLAERALGYFTHSKKHEATVFTNINYMFSPSFIG